MSVYCIEPEKCTRNLLIPPKDVCKNEKRGCVVHVDTPSSFLGYWPSQANEPLFLFFTVKERRGTPRLYNLFYLVNYLTIALTASSPSTATTTTPCGAAIVALSDVRTVLATT